MGSPPTRAMGRYSTAPAAALVTVGVTCTARWRGSTTPVTPAHSAERSSAPRLPGSVTPSTSSRNGTAAALAGQRPGPPARPRAARRPGQHALGRLGAGLGQQLRPGDVADGHPDAHGQLGDVVEHHRVVLVGGHPHLPHPAGAGQQQLADGLAAFDLIAAQALGTVGDAARAPAARPAGAAATGAPGRSALRTDVAACSAARAAMAFSAAGDERLGLGAGLGPGSGTSGRRRRPRGLAALAPFARLGPAGA